MTVNISWMTGKEKKDARRSVTINITQADIDEAVAGHGQQCVAAVCTLRALSAAHVYFFRSKVYVQWDEKPVVTRYEASKDLMRNVIQILDDEDQDNSKIKPGLYTLKAPSPTQRLGVKRDRGVTGKTRPASGKNRRAVAYTRLANAKEC